MASKEVDVGSVRDVLRVRPGSIDLARIDPAGIPVGPDSKKKAANKLPGTARRLDELQETLYAEGMGGGRRRLLLVLQGMDTSGKGGTIRHVAGLVNPQGLHVAAFRKPTRAESRHDFLWRIRHQLPGPGILGVFDRSHYEDVLVARVDKLVPAHDWRARYKMINDFEAEIIEQGTTVVKCFLHISPEVQRQRLLARLDDPAKRWKYSPKDIAVRSMWSKYQQAYVDVLERCSTEAAPWYVVPADHKWYRNWAVAQILLHTLRDMAPRYPVPDYDVAAQRSHLLDHDPLG